jgi:hypothetical protein
LDILEQLVDVAGEQLALVNKLRLAHIDALDQDALGKHRQRRDAEVNHPEVDCLVRLVTLRIADKQPLDTAAAAPG